MIALLVMLLGGCPLLLDPGTGANSYAPRIDRSFPEPGAQELISGVLLFSAEGEDDDSLDLSWTWSLDGEVQAAGTSTDGTFDTGWELSHDPALSGATVEVLFAVSDGDLEATLEWPVDIR